MRKQSHKNWIWAGILLAQFVLFSLLSWSDRAVELAARFFSWLQKLWEPLTFFVSFSLGDLFYGLLLIIFAVCIILYFKKYRRKRMITFVLIILNALTFWYYCAWGLMYFKTPLSDQLPKSTADVATIKKLASYYLELSKKYRAQCREDKNGVFTIDNIYKVKLNIRQAQLWLPEPFGPQMKPPVKTIKPSLFSGLMSYSGIMGYYNPFTTEAQYNAEMPQSSLPFTLAHEAAHQVGFAREQEANFIGYLTGMQSNDAALRYSTTYFTLKSLLRALPETEKQFVGEVLNQYSPAMKRDREAELRFAEKHRGPVELFFGFTNDLFLKSNRQEGSITYSYFVELLLQYHKLNT